MIDLFGHLAYLFLLVGTLLIGRKRIAGWLFRWVGEVIWLVLGLLMGMSSIYVWGVIFCVADLKGFLTWRNHDTQTATSRQSTN